MKLGTLACYEANQRRPRTNRPLKKLAAILGIKAEMLDPDLTPHISTENDGEVNILRNKDKLKDAICFVYDKMSADEAIAWKSIGEAILAKKKAVIVSEDEFEIMQILKKRGDEAVKSVKAHLQVFEATYPVKIGGGIADRGQTRPFSTDRKKSTPTLALSHVDSKTAAKSIMRQRNIEDHPSASAKDDIIQRHENLKNIK